MDEFDPLTRGPRSGPRQIEHPAALRERLAAIEHEQWMAWSKTIASTEDITTERRDRWARLWVPYDELPERDKEHDRVWADKVLAAGVRVGVVRGGDHIEDAFAQDGCVDNEVIERAHAELAALRAGVRVEDEGLLREARDCIGSDFGPPDVIDANQWPPVRRVDLLRRLNAALASPAPTLDREREP